jgi:rhodanese-related sulfurtransferase/DNA-binding transcriptional ArsR family regulator
MHSVARPKDALFDQLARVGKALASPKRLELLDVLAQSERSVESLAQATALKLTTASAHLQALRQGGLVQTRKEGARIYYRLAGSDVARLYVHLRDVAKMHLAETERAAAALLGEDDVEVVSRETLLDRIKQGTVVVVDVRPELEFAAAHIEGAVSIPLPELCDRIYELPTELDVVAYCRGEYCVLAYEAVRLLRSQGRRARRLSGGMLEWRLEDRPMVAASAQPVM